MNQMIENYKERIIFYKKKNYLLLSKGKSNYNLFLP